MATAPDLARYSRVAAWFHWIIAALVLLNLLLGFFHEDFDKPVRSAMMNVHKATGLTILALTVARIAWRLGHRPPPFDPVLQRWEAGLARVVHALFYVLLLALPLSGWILVSTSGRVTSWFGLFEVGPLPVSRAEDVHDTVEDVHGWFGYFMLVLIALHVAGALKHHVQGHRHLIGRMAPWGRRPAP
ncbi:MAG TPA: cytochrome b [Allosphingosinicella sp.]|nr:cytochrome b [Allosphingosinicella sp.]